MGLIQLLIGILTGKAGEQVGGAVARTAEWVTAAGMAAAVVLWLKENGTDVAVNLSLTWSELALLAVAFGPVLFIAIRLVHRAPPPG